MSDARTNVSLEIASLVPAVLPKSRTPEATLIKVTETLLNQALMLWKLGKRDLAVIYFRQTIVIYPDSHLAYRCIVEFLEEVLREHTEIFVAESKYDPQKIALKLYALETNEKTNHSCKLDEISSHDSLELFKVWLEKFKNLDAKALEGIQSNAEVTEKALAAQRTLDDIVWMHSQEHQQYLKAKNMTEHQNEKAFPEKLQAIRKLLQTGEEEKSREALAHLNLFLAASNSLCPEEIEAALDLRARAYFELKEEKKCLADCLRKVSVEPYYLNDRPALLLDAAKISPTHLVTKATLIKALERAQASQPDNIDFYEDLMKLDSSDRAEINLGVYIQTLFRATHIRYAAWYLPTDKLFKLIEFQKKSQYREASNRITRGRCALVQREFEKAITEFKTVMAEDYYHDDPLLHMICSIAYYLKNDYALALIEAQSAISAAKCFYPAAEFFLGRIYERRNDEKSEDALRAYFYFKKFLLFQETAQEFCRHPTISNLRHAECFVRKFSHSKENQEALHKESQQLVAKAEAELKQCEKHSTKRSLATAERWVKEALVYDGANWQAHLALACVYEEGQLQKAITATQQASLYASQRGTLDDEWKVLEVRKRVFDKLQKKEVNIFLEEKEKQKIDDAAQQKKLARLSQYREKLKQFEKFEKNDSSVSAKIANIINTLKDYQCANEEEEKILAKNREKAANSEKIMGVLRKHSFRLRQAITQTDSALKQQQADRIKSKEVCQREKQDIRALIKAQRQELAQLEKNLNAKKLEEQKKRAEQQLKEAELKKSQAKEKKDQNKNKKRMARLERKKERDLKQKDQPQEQKVMQEATDKKSTARSTRQIVTRLTTDTPPTTPVNIYPSRVLQVFEKLENKFGNKTAVYGGCVRDWRRSQKSPQVKCSHDYDFVIPVIESEEKTIQVLDDLFRAEKWKDFAKTRKSSATKQENTVRVYQLRDSDQCKITIRLSAALNQSYLEDAKTLDIKMNTLYMNRKAKIIAPFKEALSQVDHGILEVVGSPQRLLDDPEIGLRVVGFAARRIGSISPELIGMLGSPAYHLALKNYLSASPGVGNALLSRLFLQGHGEMNFIILHQLGLIPSLFPFHAYCLAGNPTKKRETLENLYFELNSSDALPPDFPYPNFVDGVDAECERRLAEYWYADVIQREFAWLKHFLRQLDQEAREQKNLSHRLTLGDLYAALIVGVVGDQVDPGMIQHKWAYIKNHVALFNELFNPAPGFTVASDPIFDIRVFQAYRLHHEFHRQSCSSSEDSDDSELSNSEFASDAEVEVSPPVGNYWPRQNYASFLRTTDLLPPQCAHAPVGLSGRNMLGM